MTIAFLFLAFYIWAVRKGQFDDLVTPAHEMLVDDTRIENQKLKQNEKKLTITPKDSASTRQIKK